MHKTIEPTILYFGTPVALISTLNPDGSPNLAPMSSAWWLGWSCMLGLGQMGQTSDNLIRTRECVINLPSEDLVTQVDPPRPDDWQESRAGEETSVGLSLRT
jgi:flavin reductase (DIM6/NTAB) family NADH-FMN oxidoreductase RutF